MPRDQTRRWLLRVTGTATAASLAGCASVVNEFPTDGGKSSGSSGQGGAETAQPATGAPGEKQVSSKGDADQSSGDDSEPSEPLTIESPDVELSGVPVPSERSRYARMGRDSASVTATVYGSWKCPYTQEFVLNMLPEVVNEFVEPGDLTLEYRSIAYLSGEPFLGPDAPRAAESGLTVWDIDPQSYWSYFAYVFANQPQEGDEWAQLETLVRIAEAAGVPNRSQLRQSIQNGTYAGPVRATTEAANQRDIATVPRLVVDGTVSAPTVDFEATLSQLEQATRD